jgi:hypothetical protein
LAREQLGPGVVARLPFDGVQMLPYHAVIGFSDISANAMVGANSLAKNPVTGACGL